MCAGHWVHTDASQYDLVPVVDTVSDNMYSAMHRKKTKPDMKKQLY